MKSVCGPSKPKKMHPLFDAAEHHGVPGEAMGGQYFVSVWWVTPSAMRQARLEDDTKALLFEFAVDDRGGE